MSQFRDPFKIEPFLYDDLTLYEADTAKTKSVSAVQKKEKSKSRLTLVDISMVMFICMVGLMSIYTFFIVCVELFKIFIFIVAR